MGSWWSRASMGCFLDPLVTFETCELSGLLPSPQIDTTLLVQNRNPASLTATSISYTLTKASDGTVLARGVRNKSFQIPAMDSKTVLVPTALKIWGVGSAGMSLMQRGETKLNVDGSIAFQSTRTKETTSIAIPFSGSTEIQLQQPIKLQTL